MFPYTTSTAGLLMEVSLSHLPFGRCSFDGVVASDEAPVLNDLDIDITLNLLEIDGLGESGAATGSGAHALGVGVLLWRGDAKLITFVLGAAFGLRSAQDELS